MNLHFNGSLSVFFRDDTLRNISWKLDTNGQPVGTVVRDDPLPPSYSLPVEPRISLDRVSFGDGYEQVTESGINPVKLVFKVRWSHLRVQQATALFRFFNGEGISSIYYRRPSEWFYWKPPPPFSMATSLPRRFICVEFPVTLNQWNDSEIQATFEESFQP